MARATARALSLAAVAGAGDHEDVARLELAALELEEGSAELPGLVRPLVDVCRVRLEEADARRGGRPGAARRTRARQARRSTISAARASCSTPCSRSAPLRRRRASKPPFCRASPPSAAEPRTPPGRTSSVALELAESDAIRRPFTSGGPEVTAILRRTIRHGTAHRWLVGSLLAVVDGREARDGHRARELLEPLSVRETVVLRYLPTLLSNQEIAGELFVSVNTVKTHLKSIYRKLGVVRPPRGREAGPRAAARRLRAHSPAAGEGHSSAGPNNLSEMSTVAVQHPGKGRSRRLLEILLWFLGIAAVVGILDLLGVDVSGWFSDLWDSITALSAATLIGAIVLQTGQTIFAGVSYYGILSAAYPRQVRLAPIITAYAVGVAMNNFLPANIGTFVTLLMFIALIPSATLGGSIAAYLVQKIFFTVAGAAIYLYLFLSVPGRSTSTSATSAPIPVHRSGSSSAAAS